MVATILGYIIYKKLLLNITQFICIYDVTYLFILFYRLIHLVDISLYFAFSCAQVPKCAFENT